jgi:two-component system response regulator WspF
MNVAIVNDSRAAAEVLRRIVAAAKGFRLLWTAYSGEEAVVLAQASHPDIILMDLIMPGIDGAETTRRIMQSAPCVVLVVTATTVGNRDLVFEAMGHGALDAVNTPTLGTGGDMQGAEPLLQKLRTVARLVAPPRASATQPPAAGSQRAQDSSRIPIVAIGASTGGPQALARVLTHLPAEFPAAVLVAQHVDQHFAQGLSDWLQGHTPLVVRIARNDEKLSAATVYIAGTNDHLIYKDGGSVAYTPDPESSPYRPSVDVLFSSLAQPHRAACLGVLLTGMGRDGAEGLLAMRQSGALTIAQDADTSIVYGMPKAAAELEAAAEILPLNSIGPRIRTAIFDSNRTTYN